MASTNRAAKLGKKVALIENRKIGGTCVNVGCVPKKVMFNLAQFLDDAKHTFGLYGVKGLDGLSLDYPEFKKIRT